MFSYRLKSIKRPSAFCCEKVNKPVCLGQLSIYSSLKKKASSIIPVLVVLSFFFKDLFCNDLLVLQSGKTLSAKMHMREMNAVLLLLFWRDLSQGRTESRIQKGSLHVHQKAAC